MSNRRVAKRSYCYNIVSFTQSYVYTSATGNACIHISFMFNSIQFNLFHPRIIIHDMGQVKQFPYVILDHYSELAEIPGVARDSR
jgi:hypothetical protein